MAQQLAIFLYTIMKIDQLIPKTNDIKLLESRLYFKDDCEMSKLLVRIKFLLKKITLIR